MYSFNDLPKKEQILDNFDEAFGKKNKKQIEDYVIRNGYSMDEVLENRDIDFKEIYYNETNLDKITENIIDAIIEWMKTEEGQRLATNVTGKSSFSYSTIMRVYEYMPPSDKTCKSITKLQYKIDFPDAKLPQYREYVTITACINKKGKVTKITHSELHG